MDATANFLHSSLREKLLEHVFLGDLFRCLWRRGIHSVEVLRPETDFAGYDIAIECLGVLRHIQLKSSHRLAKTSDVAIQTRLAEKPSGCVIWIRFDSESLALGPYLWFGGLPGDQLPLLGARPARHTRHDKEGVRKIRSGLRMVRKSQFTPIEDINSLVDVLFGTKQQSRRSVV